MVVVIRHLCLLIMTVVVDREAAWNQVMSLGTTGSGNSKANSLFWVASRPPARPNYNSSIRPVGPQQSVKAACASNSACDVLGSSYCTVTHDHDNGF